MYVMSEETGSSSAVCSLNKPPFTLVKGQDLTIIIIITNLYSAFRSEDTEALDAAQED